MAPNLRSLADADIQTALSYYQTQAGQDVALDFIDQLESALKHIGQHPPTGSLRFAYELEIPDLRSWTLQKFPHSLFYVANDTSVDVWRLLHARRDIPAFLSFDQSE